MKPERKRMLFDLTVWIASSLLAVSLLVVDAQAKSRNLAADNPTWRAECGSCHVAYPVALLPAEDWRRLMGSLDRHFGADAAVEAKSAAEIERFLSANAGRGDGAVGQAPPRLTTTRWFQHEHRKVSAAVFASPTVKTAANCAACHPGAAAGDFDEHAVRIPR
jgi:cytochrome c553